MPMDEKHLPNNGGTRQKLFPIFYNCLIDLIIASIAISPLVLLTHPLLEVLEFTADRDGVYG